MKFATFPASKNDGSLVQLTDFFDSIPENNFIWSILDFYGIGTAPNELSMEDFEKLIRSKSQGYIMSWDELKNFAASLNQTYDCLIVAAKSLPLISIDQSAKENFSDCEIIIEAFDSTEWAFWSRDESLMKKVKPDK